jgi:hypothetical protein
MIEEIKTELDEHTKRNLVINSVPVSVIKLFKDFCKQECGDVYAVGLYQLLLAKKRYDDLIPLLSNILKEKTNNQKNERRTFADE